MPYQISAKVKKDNRAVVQQMIKGLAGAVIMKHALGSTSTLYQIYPVGPEHKDGSPHTRDTFAIVKYEGSTPPSTEGSDVVASHGEFSGASQKFEIGKGKKLGFIAAGASFFLEFGTIYIEARPLIREMIKRAHSDISKELRALNIRAKRI